MSVIIGRKPWVVALALTAVSLWHSQAAAQQTASDQPAQARWGQAVSQSPRAQNDLHGMVSPRHQVTLAAPFEGVLMDVQVEEGQRVNKDQPLAIMDLRVAAAAVKVAKLQAEDTETIEHAKLSYMHANLQLNRVKEAYDGKAASQWELREAMLSRDQARVAYDLAVRKSSIDAAVLKLEREKLARHTVRAPFDGQVVRVLAQPGTSLTAADPILMLVALQTLEAQIQLPLKLYGKLSRGEVYLLDAQEPVSKPIEGTLKMIDPVIDPASRTFRCVFDIDNENDLLPAGFTLQLKLDARTGQPLTATGDGARHASYGPPAR